MTVRAGTGAAARAAVTPWGTIAAAWLAVAPAGAAAQDATVEPAAPRAAVAAVQAGLAVTVQDGAPQLHTSTAHVEALAVLDGDVWAATRGGLERYDAETLERERVYTTLDGLAANALVDVEVGPHRAVVARSRGARCTLDAEDRFSCAPEPSPSAPRIAPGRFLGAHRITAEVVHDGARWVGTTDGLFVVRPGSPPRRVTPTGQICGNHVTDVVAWGGRTWLGTFADGLCTTEGEGFRAVDTPFRMVNDLEPADGALWVAASEGLFRTRDGARFERVHRRAVPDGANGLARDGDHLWVTTPASLHRIRLVRGSAPTRSWWLPGGSTAVQDLAVRDGVAWLVTEDRGVVRVDAAGATLLDRAAGLPTSWAYTVDIDPAGGAWIGTLRHGLLRVDADGGWRPVPLPDRWLLRVRHDAAGLLVGTQGGAFLVREGRVLAIPHVPDPRVHEVARLGDTLWVGTEGGTLALVTR